MGPLDVVILCGGRGTRLQAHTAELPKPLVEIGGEPILWHVIRGYAAQGLRRFTLCTGYKGDLIERAARGWSSAGLEIRCVDTGVDTPTGGRLTRVRELLPEGPFLLGYADGLADVDLERLVERHRSHGGLATMTVVRPELQFGVAELDGDRVRGFREKPRSEHWVNAGFFCLEPEALDYVRADSAFERSALVDLAAAGELRAFRHDGFWDCMDTYKDAILLDDLWRRGEAPWKLWADQTGT